MKKLYLLIAAVIIGIMLPVTGCGTSASKDTISVKGTVKFIDLEGGFYGIIGDDGKNYDPINLAQEFRQDGLRVRFEAKISENQVSTHMWGTIVEITKIEKLQ